MLGTRATRDNSDTGLAKYDSRVECVVDMFGPVDFVNPDPANANGIQLMILRTFFARTREQAPDLYREGSPIIYVSADSAPFLILHGTKDPLVPIDQSRRLYDALRRSKVEATLVPMPGDGHGFHIPDNVQRALALTLEFFDKHLHP
jgi:dipeptidyl aminopeptidase/acylaminoacyl peptidase